MCKRLKSMARPEGFEPPAYRSVVASEPQLHGPIGKTCSIFQYFARLYSLSVPALPYQPGNNSETIQGDEFRSTGQKRGCCNIRLSLILAKQNYSKAVRLLVYDYTGGKG